jgi:hypothetical protein
MARKLREFRSCSEAWLGGNNAPFFCRFRPMPWFGQSWIAALNFAQQHLNFRAGSDVFLLMRNEQSFILRGCFFRPVRIDAGVALNRVLTIRRLFLAPGGPL